MDSLCHLKLKLAAAVLDLIKHPVRSFDEYTTS